MNDIMYDVPSDERVRKCIITEDTVNGGKPEFEYVEE